MILFPMLCCGDISVFSVVYITAFPKQEIEVYFSFPSKILKTHIDFNITVKPI